jgi:hypothetical protein
MEIAPQEWKKGYPIRVIEKFWIGKKEYSHRYQEASGLHGYRCDDEELFITVHISGEDFERVRLKFLPGEKNGKCGRKD